MATPAEVTSSGSSSSDADKRGGDIVNTTTKASEYNVFRDSLLRYCGYANEVGESFRYQFPRLVGPTYGIAFGYCLADAVSSGYTAYYCPQQQQQPAAKKLDEQSRSTNSTSFSRTISSALASPVEEGNNNNNNTDSTNLQRAATGAFDTLLWQSLASVLIPGVTIHGIVRATRWLVMPRSSKIMVPVLVAQWLPTAVGLGSVPFIVHPIDGLVDYVLDNTTRTLYKVS